MFFLRLDHAITQKEIAQVSAIARVRLLPTNTPTAYHLSEKTSLTLIELGMHGNLRFRIPLARFPPYTSSMAFFSSP